MPSPTAALKWFAHFDSGGTRIDEEGEYPCLGANGPIGTSANPNVSKPAVLVGRVGSAGEARLLMDPAFVTDNCIIVNPDSRTDVKFLYYSILAADLRRLVGTTAQPLLVASDLKQVPFRPLPKNEQVTLVKFLDRETTRVDSLIADKVRQLELLEEKERAIVCEAVTKGLNPQAPLSDSKVEWIGPIPSHWHILRTRFLCQVTTGDGDTQDAVPDGPYPFFVRSPFVERAERFSFDCEGVLTSGDGAGVGKIFHHFIGRFHAHQRVYVFFNFRSMLPRFFYYFLREKFREVALAGNAKSTVDSLRRPMILDFPVVVPPYAEQREIVTRLDAVASGHAAISSAIQHSVDLLREYRQSLITAAVTDQLDSSVYMPKEPIQA
jgi:type I restriction enzyme, S subunit